MNKAVVITGASSGIGKACVERMQTAGWQVFATVRKAADREKLQAAKLAGVVPVLMDVSDGSSITAAAAEIGIHLDGKGLDGLVNVAGIGMVRPLEYTRMEDVREIFEIFFLGSWRLPRHLHDICGRIVAGL
jgi:NAD(P)-dependent dehydrogenase (short-subunit alcohol dehydrogenase family)